MDRGVNVKNFPVYLSSKKKKSKVVHIWTGLDTFCRMFSTGGMRKKNYHVTMDREEKTICKMCMVNYKKLPYKIDFRKVMEHEITR